MTIRDHKQDEFANMYLQRKGTIFDDGGILYLCPRFGKIRTSIQVFLKGGYTKILVAYPDTEIKKSWIKEFKETGTIFLIEYTTHRSLFKHSAEKYDLVVIDEIHLLSEAQIGYTQDIIDTGNKILGLTGTMNIWTERKLAKSLGLNVVARYSIDEAIHDGIIPDYEIHISKVPLDNKSIGYGKKKDRTEKRQFDAYSYVIDKLEEEERDTRMLRLQRMRLIQRSLSKLEQTKSLLDTYQDDRVLVFCGLTNIADSLGIPSYHSKVAEKSLFDDFVDGKYKHLAVVKIGNTGVTYRPLNRVIINYFDSNSENLAQKIFRCMSLEYDNPEKKAIIHIVTSDEEVELKWLKKALEFFDDSKIK